MLNLAVVAPSSAALQDLMACLTPAPGILVRQYILTDITQCHRLQNHVFLAILGLATLDPTLASYLKGMCLKRVP